MHVSTEDRFEERVSSQVGGRGAMCGGSSVKPNRRITSILERIPKCAMFEVNQ